MKIVLDTNVLIDFKSGKCESKKIFESASRNKSIILIPENVLKEWNRIDTNSSNFMMKIIQKCNNEFRFIKNSGDIKIQANSFSEQYSACHFPDNLILATAKTNDAILVTRDQNLRKVAEFLGVMSCNPKNFGGYVIA